MGRLDGKVAIITGGASGMGAAGAKLFAEEGAKVVIADIQDDKGASVEKEIRDAGNEAAYIHCNLVETNEVDNLIKAAVEKFGRIDIFWHNAGNAGPVLDNTTPENFDLCISLHIKAGLFGAKASIEEMKKTGGGSIIFTSSISGLRPSRSSVLYSICKSGELMMGKCLANYCGKYNIRSNVICPGSIETPLLPSFFGRSEEDDFEAIKAGYLEKIPMRRLGVAEDIAKTALWLASDEASYINGDVISVDGGLFCC